MLDRFAAPIAAPFIDKISAFLEDKEIPFYMALAASGVCGIAGCFLAGMQFYPAALFILCMAKLAGAAAAKDGTQKQIFSIAAADIIMMAAFTFFFSLGQMQTATAAAFLIFSLAVTGLARAAQIFLAAPRRDFNGQSETVLFLIASCFYPQGFAAIAAVFGILWMAGGAWQMWTIARQG